MTCTVYVKAVSGALRLVALRADSESEREVKQLGQIQQRCGQSSDVHFKSMGHMRIFSLMTCD